MSLTARAGDAASLWYAVHTKPRREEHVRAHLERTRIAVFLPRIREKRWKGGAPAREVHPLFPGYLFASFETGRELDKVRWAPGVKKVVGNGDEPVPVEDDVISLLRARQGTRDYIVPRRTLLRGERVRVVKGPLAGLVGVVDSPCSGEERVKVLLELFRQRVRVEIEAASVTYCN